MVFRPLYWVDHECRHKVSRAEDSDSGRPDDAKTLRVELSFGALTVAVTLIGAAVVKQHIDSQPTVDLVESVAATR